MARRSGAAALPGTAGLRPLGRGTVSRRLIVRVAALVAVIAFALDATSLAITRTVLIRGIDDQLRSAVAVGQFTLPQDDSGSWATNGLGVEIVGTTVRRSFVARDQRVTQLTLDQINELRQATAQATSTIAGRPAAIATVYVPSLGDYRVVRSVAGPTEWIIGLSLEGLAATMARLLFLELVLTAVAVVVAAVVVATVVRVTLRPLTRLAQTAATVAYTPLDRGEVHLPVRVDPRDANPASEVGQVGLALNTMLDNVEYALASRQRSETQVRQFVADASHELRNPLAAIRGYAELTSRHAGDLPDDDAFALGRIDAESKRMSKLVENLLLLARLDNGQQPGFTPVDAGEVLANALSDAQVTGPDHVWALSVPDEPLMVWADANQLHQVVANLLANARKHTPAGTHVEAAARGEEAPGWIVITVTDDGPGIPPELIDHVFERFARADAARTHDEEGSSGLGLAIVAAVVAAHGGHVSVDSRPGRTCFTIALPAYRDQPATA